MTIGASLLKSPSQKPTLIKRRYKLTCDRHRANTTIQIIFPLPIPSADLITRAQPSLRLLYGSLAQLVEQRIENPRVLGSNPR